MDGQTSVPSGVSCTVAGQRYQEAAVFIATFVAHLHVYGESGGARFATKCSADLQEDEIRMLR